MHVGNALRPPVLLSTWLIRDEEIVNDVAKVNGELHLGCIAHLGCMVEKCPPTPNGIDHSHEDRMLVHRRRISRTYI